MQLITCHDLKDHEIYFIISTHNSNNHTGLQLVVFKWILFILLFYFYTCTVIHNTTHRILLNKDHLCFCYIINNPIHVFI